MIHASTVHSSRQQEQEYLAGWQRARAELDNFRRRVAAERAADRGRLVEEVGAALLPLADNFRAAAAHVPAELAGNPWADGVLHIGRQVEQLLAELGLETIDAAGAPFDPAQHEAVGEEPSDAKPGIVVAVIQPGYRVGERVIRPARVKIAA